MLLCRAIFLLLYILCLTNAQCPFPNDQNFQGAAGDIGAGLKNLEVSCIAHSTSPDSYSSTVVGTEFLESFFNFALIEAYCDGTVWKSENFSTFQSRLNVTLLQPCFRCSLNLSETVCSPCHPNCSMYEAGSGRCFGSGSSDCCPYYSSETKTCVTDCPSGNISTQFECLPPPPAIMMTVDGREFRALTGDTARNYYIYDTLQGSSSDLNIKCSFEGDSNQVQVLQNNSFWRVSFTNSTVDSMIQSSMFLANLTDQDFSLPTTSGLVNVSFVSGSAMTLVGFNPGFSGDLAGTFQCHSSATFSVDSPVSVIITTENPVFQYTGNTTLNLAHPLTSFNLTGLYAEYLFGGIQRIADSELLVYYMDEENERVSGSIQFIDLQDRSYMIEFSEPLDPVTEVVIEMDLMPTLGLKKTIALTVNSHGLEVQPSTQINVLIGSNVTLVCQSRVPGVSVRWDEDSDSSSSSLVIQTIRVSISAFCDVVDDPSYPETAPSSVEVMILAFPEPVSIRSSNSNNFFPQPSLYSQELETMFSITCNSLPGNGNLKWTTDAEDLVNDLSQLPSDSGSVISVSPTELRLELTTLAYSETSGNLTCTSLDSGLSATVFLPGMPNYLSVLDQPREPLSIGQEFVIFFLVAAGANGLRNMGPTNFQMVFQNSESSIPMSRVRRSFSNVFIYELTLLGTSELNNTFTARVNNGPTTSISLAIRSFPEITIVNSAPFRYVAREIVTLQCSTSDPNATVFWFDLLGDFVQVTPPQFNVSQTEGVSSLLLIPYIFNIRYEMYPSVNLGLSDIGTVDLFSWTQISYQQRFVCSACDDRDFNLFCSPFETVDSQTITLEPLYHEVTWSIGNTQIYNGSIRNNNGLDNIELLCRSTKNNGDLGLRSDNPVINQYLAAELFDEPFVLSNFTTVSVDVGNNNNILLKVNGTFTQSLSGEYTCYSRQSGVESTVLLTTESYYVEFLVASPATYILGTLVFIPYRSAARADGFPSNSRNNYLTANAPRQSIANYEVSPYNFGLYLPVLTSSDAGNYTVFIDNDGSIESSTTLALEIEFPTITVPNGNVSVREGNNITISCTPSNPSVQLYWSIDPPADPTPSELSGSDYTFDSNLRHSVTFRAQTFNERSYYCYVRGDQSTKNVQPGEVHVNVLLECPQEVIAGVLYNSSLEGDTVTVPCNRISSKFTNSRAVTVSRDCIGQNSRFRWLIPQFSTCTLTEDVTDPFAVLDFLLRADNISTVMSNEAQIINEVRGLLGGNVSQVTELYVLRYIQYSSFVAVVLEATFSQEYADMVDLFTFYGSLFTLGGFGIERRDFYGFQPSDICVCNVISTNLGVPIIPEEQPEQKKRNIEDNIVPIFSVDLFHRLCVGVSVEPCQCTTGGSCQCQDPFVGDGSLCTADSDGDGFPAFAINSQNCNQSLDTQPSYCFNDTCPNIYNPEQNPPVCDITVEGGCPAEVDTMYRIEWPSTAVNTTSTQACGGSNVIGLATRYCGDNGNWLTVNASNCQSRVFVQIRAQSSAFLNQNPSTLNSTELEEASTSARETLGELAVATSPQASTSLFPIELSTSNEVLSGAISVLLEDFNRNGNTSNIDPTSFGNTFSNLLDADNAPGWESLQDDNPDMGSELLLDNAEDFGLLLASSLEEDQELLISTENIVIRAKQVSIQPDQEIPDISFPEADDLGVFGQGDTVNASIVIPSALLRERAGGRTNVPVANILFNNLQEFLESINATGSVTTGTLIISSQVATQSGNDDNSVSLQDTPVILRFDVKPENFSSPSCVFWQISSPIGTGFWSTSGIQTMFVEGSRSVTCSSQHLTSFAVLVDTTGLTTRLTEEEALALSVVTYIGLTISIVCLLVTVAFFLSFGKGLFEKVHNFVHLNLAVALLLAYLVFVSGVETAVGNKAGCTIVAALIHYFFLCAFCWMMCEGVMLYLMMVVVFSTLSKKWWFFLLLGWLPPLLPVVITVGVAHDYYTAGEKYCWLSVEDNVIWAFVIPMIVIILINSVFFVLVLFSLVKNKGTKNAMKMQESNRTDLVIVTLKASLVLLPLLGLTWVFGLLAIVQETTFFAWMFTILNCFQGAAILFFHVIRNERIWNRISKRYRKLTLKSNEYSSSEHSTSTFEKKRKYFTPKEKTSSTAVESYALTEKSEFAPIQEPEQEADIEKDKPIVNEYVEIGDFSKKSDKEKEAQMVDPQEEGPQIVNGGNEDDGGVDVHKLRYSVHDDPDAPFELVNKQ